MCDVSQYGCHQRSNIRYCLQQQKLLILEISQLHTLFLMFGSACFLNYPRFLNSQAATI